MKDFWIDISATQFLVWANDAFIWQNESKKTRQIIVEGYCDMFYYASCKKHRVNFIGNRGQTISIEDLINNNL